MISCFIRLCAVSIARRGVLRDFLWNTCKTIIFLPVTVTQIPLPIPSVLCILSSQSLPSKCRTSGARRFVIPKVLTTSRARTIFADTLMSNSSISLLANGTISTVHTMYGLYTISAIYFCKNRDWQDELTFKLTGDAETQYFASYRNETYTKAL